MTQPQAAAEAIEYLGGPVAVARLLHGRGVRLSRQAVEKWRRSLPPKHVLLVEELTERRWTRYDLRPDIYPREARPVERLAA